jgi:signal peptidase II
VAGTRGHHRGTFAGAAAVVVALDQLTKHWALNALADGPVDVVGSLRFNLVFNDSAAFSLGGGNTTVKKVEFKVICTELIR